MARARRLRAKTRKLLVEPRGRAIKIEQPQKIKVLLNCYQRLRNASV
jgi:hypothetical protein